MPPDLFSPNLTGVDRFACDPRTVEKPWGSELIWALTDAYAGKILFVREGESLSLQFHNEKDEAWYVLEGRARLELGKPGEGVLAEEVIAARPGVPLPARHGAPADRACGHADPRGLDSAARRRRPARGQLRPRGHLRTLTRLW